MFAHPTRIPIRIPKPILLILLLLLLLLVGPTFAFDLSTDAAALLALRAALHGYSIPWNNTSTSPCTWPYVVCSSSRVTELHLPGRSLSGQIPAPLLSNLTALTFLSLRFNSLSGPLPDDLSSLSNLQYLYFQGNKFSGPIGEPILGLKGLVRLVLAGNEFSGGIPAALGELKGLKTLDLGGNRLTGKIPDFGLDGLEIFNVSDNLLTGRIPKGLSGLPTSSFEGNRLCGKPLVACKKKLSDGAIAGIVIGVLVVSAVLFLVLFLLCCRKKRGDDENGEKGVEVVEAKGAAMDVEKEGKTSNVEQQRGAVAVAGEKEKGKGGGVGLIDKTLVFFGDAPKNYDLEDLLRASAEVLGKGTYGTTYKATLDVGVAVAVKRLKDVTAGEEEFKAKMEEIGRMRHENLVQLKAYHCSPNEKLLVSEYMPKGSLSSLLHGNRGNGRTPLSWETRSAIVFGAARGIAYIHSQGPTTAHGNIKTSNILLSNSYEARVTDYGIAQIVTPSSPPQRATGYRAPEVTDPQKASQKADVYSFGVFILELLTGKSPAQTPVNEEGVDLPRWVQSVVKEDLASEVFDMELLRYQNVEEEMVQLLQLAIACTAQHPDSRPTMEDVRIRIEEACRPTSPQMLDPVSDIVSDADNYQSP
ncbi:hypothetical protein Drorol1_Dr00012021 [Drosera rotundifolia]